MHNHQFHHIRLSRWQKLIALLLLAGYGAYCFYLHYQEPLDGDLPRVVVPAAAYQTVMANPFGLAAIMDGTTYPATNRFMAHYSMYAYFRTMPLFLQRFLAPIDSVYASIAIYKILLQFFIGWLLAAYASGTTAIRDSRFIVALLLVFPFFQSTIYANYMGIIVSPVTYTHFYALPLALLLLFFLPFYLGNRPLPTSHVQSDITTQLSIFQKAGWILLPVLLSFSGPLIPPLVLMVGAAIFLGYWYQSVQTQGWRLSAIRDAFGRIPRFWRWTILIFMGLSLYSFYLGTFNTENSGDIPLLDKYRLLGLGLVQQLTGKPGFSLLLVLTVGYAFLVKKYANKVAATTLVQAATVLFGLMAIYIILLPLGGYREYRPKIVRFDTLMPVTMALIFLYVRTALQLLNDYKPPFRRRFLLFLTAIALLFISANQIRQGRNTCERKYLQAMADNPTLPSAIRPECPVLSWYVAGARPDSIKIKMLHIWEIVE